MVPTYNYMVVHAHGPLQTYDDPHLLSAMSARQRNCRARFAAPERRRRARRLRARSAEGHRRHRNSHRAAGRKMEAQPESTS